MSSIFKFNMISNEGAKGLEEYYQELIDKNTQGHFRYEAEMSLAFLSWRKGDSGSTKRFFYNAASEVVSQLSGFTHFGTTRIIAEFETPLLIVNLFGSDADRKMLSSIPLAAWYYPTTEEYLPLAELLVLINKIFISKEINPVDIDQILQKNCHVLANQYYRDWIEVVCNGLSAIASKEADTLNDAVKKILALHEHESDEGAWKKRVEAMISLWACVIYKIAINNAIEVSVNSPYLPKNIL